MSAIFVKVVIAATGVPQKIVGNTLPVLPAVTVLGVTYPSGSATQVLSEIQIQAGPTNVAPLLVGGAGMVPATFVGVGRSLVASAVLDIRPNGGVTLDDIWLSGTAADVALIVLEG